jgi:glycosyltransferase involved in cell wall biosynthesis
MKTKKIILIVGGEDVYMRIPLIRELEKKGFEVCVAGSAGEEIFRSNNISFFYYDLNRSMSIFNDITTVKELRRIFKHIKPNLVQSFDTKPSILMPFASIGLPHKVVRTITGMGYAFSSTSFFSSILRNIYKFFQIILDRRVDISIFQNEDDFSYFKKNNLLNNHEGLLIRGSGIDLKKIDSLDIASKKDYPHLIKDDDSCTFLMVSRLVMHKGVMDYLQAAREVKSIYSNCNFILVGPLEKDGEDSISEEELFKFSSIVKWLGPRDDVMSIMDISDVFVLPTYYREGLPRVLLEASSKYLPSITSDMPGCRDVIHNESEGFLIPIKNVDFLKKSMIKLIKSSELRETMGKNARHRVENNFSLDLVSRYYAETYNSLISKNNP